MTPQTEKKTEMNWKQGCGCRDVVVSKKEAPVDTETYRASGLRSTRVIGSSFDVEGSGFRGLGLRTLYGFYCGSQGPLCCVRTF